MVARSSSIRAVTSLPSGMPRPDGWRASAVGIYRLWRDIGFAVGALLAGAVADRFGMPAAIWSVAALTALSGVVVLVRMEETMPARGPAGAVATSP